MRVESLELRVESRSRQPVRSRLALRARSLNPQPSIFAPRPRGLTLIELLVVIIILTTLVSAAIPLLAPTNDDRRLREASRGVNSFISAAQMKAVQLQRPYGVALKRLSLDTAKAEDNAVCIELFYVEQPAPYRGFDRTSSAMVARHTNPVKTGSVLIQFMARGNASNTDGLPPGWDADLFPPNLIRPGDVIEIDGTQYRLVATNDNVVTSQATVDSQGFFQAVSNTVIVRLEAQPLNDTGQMLNVEFDRIGRRMRDLPAGSTPLPPFWTNPAPYKILRQPMPANAEPFQMPEGTAIDLRASGQAIAFQGSGAAATAAGFFYNSDPANVNVRLDNAENIIIMFTPEGAVERVRFNQKNAAITNAPDNIFDGRTVSNLYLLIGRRENAPPPALANDKTLGSLVGLNDQQMQDIKETLNWLRGESRWIAIGSQSGRVVTVENAFVDPRTMVIGEPDDVRRARQIEASREFAREMTQVGGR